LALGPGVPDSYPWCAGSPKRSRAACLLTPSTAAIWVQVRPFARAALTLPAKARWTVATASNASPTARRSAPSESGEASASGSGLSSQAAVSVTASSSSVAAEQLRAPAQDPFQQRAERELAGKVLRDLDQHGRARGRPAGRAPRPGAEQAHRHGPPILRPHRRTVTPAGGREADRATCGARPGVKAPAGVHSSGAGGALPPLGRAGGRRGGRAADVSSRPWGRLPGP
jgi:hypothetical protein